MDIQKIEKRLRTEIETSSSPYADVAGGVYLQRAWERGAEFAVVRMVEILKEARSYAAE
ncbi:MAG: hypothetical protein AAF903_02585 [Pseudomonadota bacterium]